MTEVWTKWESVVINGVFPLRRFLSRSDHSVVFLTEHKTQNLADAAIKLLPADPQQAEAQLSHLRTIAALSHPHLIRLLEVGHCQLGGQQFLFMVMEYAEQTLAQILARRALTLDEVLEMLPPTLDALAFLHRKNLVQGQVKPPNILAVNDQLKLASDTIRLAGESTTGLVKPSVYDPPEARNGRISAAGDIWALGMTMVEALTQSLPTWPDGQSETPSLPANLPEAFADTARRCLSRNAANRPAAADLEAQMQMKADPQPPVVSVAQPIVNEATALAPAAPSKSPKMRWLVPAIVALLLLAAAVWVGARLLRSHAAPPQPPPISHAPLQEAPPAQASLPIPKTSVPVLPTVLHQQIPDLPRGVRESIRGHIKIAVRVTVDRSGNVVDTTLQNPVSSRYFARLATAAARKWRFSSDSQDSREWLLRFEFTRGGATGTAIPRS